ncbi:cyclophilin family peptidyl-prolyl cis-trans isomerase/predicted small lipoprotein YifL [Paenibacillus phyllosphaerae]|uniref:Peptidyl-prolyl cis-trans isomerase n=1 Tax=Paenibacillus phyllosphaerae TaxID=274593 RepID=A0A7W5AXA1_9BACL|nr:peptidylprolyl isomerase [Paenibacillus phyllosphaerae]MBB3110377.1 cyclophilin family peptidyl-prolyl cis-trans isomerase/predicted small lipoprotein YifL [Paenibacillus phyllosphaerae]
MQSKRILTITVLAALLLVAAGCGAKEQLENNAANNATTGGGTTQTEPSNTAGNAASEDAAGGETATDEPTDVKSWDAMPEMTIDQSKTYLAHFTTNKGDFTVELFAKDAPQTVNSFVFLSNEKFYDGVKFHRIIETFMIQTGDPTGTGSGGPGYNIPDELDNGYKYDEGIVAMANTGAPDSGGSQFFICTGADAANLNSMPNYTIFGKVVEGMDVVTAIAQTPVEASQMTGEVSVPSEEIKIETISIETK